MKLAREGRWPAEGGEEGERERENSEWGGRPNSNLDDNRLCSSKRKWCQTCHGKCRRLMEPRHTHGCFSRQLGFLNSRHLGKVTVSIVEPDQHLTRWCRSDKVEVPVVVDIVLNQAGDGNVETC